MKKFLISGILALTATAVNAEDSLLYVATETLQQGTETVLSIGLNNGSMKVNTLGCNIYLPEGIEFVLTEGQTTAELSDRKVDHTVSTALQSDGSAYYLVMSMTNANIKGTDGVLFTTPIRVTGEPGEYRIMMNNMEIVDDNLDPHRVDVDTYFTVTVTAAEVKRYGDNQLYAKDITINQGENASLSIGYNSTSDVYEYSADIILPTGASATDVTFSPVVTEVPNFTNDWSFSAPILNVNGAYGGGRRDVPAEGGDVIIATAALNTASLAPGEYVIKVQNQILSNDDDDFEPESYDAILTVIGTAVEERCEAPVISINEDGHIVATCATEGAKINTTITVEDHKTVVHDSGEAVPVTGQYLITSYATKEGMAQSETSTAMLAWAKAFDPNTSVDILEAGTERAILVYSVGENIAINGTSKDEAIELYCLNGDKLYEGKATDSVFVIPVALEKGNIYVVYISKTAVKYLF